MTFLNFTFQDPSPLISYSSGQWVEGSPTNDTFSSNYSQGSFKVTFTAEATATLTFVGNSITIYGAKRLNHGNYSVVLDNGPVFIGDGNGNNSFQFPLWNAQNLMYSLHTVVFTNVPTSQGKFSDLDFVSIGREIGPSGYNGPIFDVTIDDESPFITYEGSWAPIFSATALNSSLHNTTEAGASVSLSFQGSSVELYGLYVNAPFQVNLDDQAPLDLAGPNVDLNAQQQHPRTLLFYADGLNENQTHLVKLTNTISNAGRPLYFDYAIIRSSQAFLNDTPSLNASSTVSMSKSPTSANSTTTLTRTRSVPDGAIIGAVVGGVGGLIILAFIGFFLLRRSRFYHPPRPKSTEGQNANQCRLVRMLARNGGITPFILSSTTQTLSSPAQSFNGPTFSKSPCPSTVPNQPVTQQTHLRLASIASESDSRLSGDPRNRLDMLLDSTNAT